MTTQPLMPGGPPGAVTLQLGLFNQIACTGLTPNGSRITVTIHPASLTLLANILRHTASPEHACWHFHNRAAPLPCTQCRP